MNDYRILFTRREGISMGNFSEADLRAKAIADFHDPSGTSDAAKGIVRTDAGGLNATLAALSGADWWEAANILRQPTGNPADAQFKVVPMGNPQPGQLVVPCLWSKPGPGDTAPVSRRENHYCSGPGALYNKINPQQFDKTD
jgi:hypothetical protein